MTAAESSFVHRFASPAEIRSRSAINWLPARRCLAIEEECWNTACRDFFAGSRKAFSTCRSLSGNGVDDVAAAKDSRFEHYMDNRSG
jgi:hypothetical protein